MDIPRDLVNLLRQAERIAVLTGAGVSQESGLRTFPGCPDRYMGTA